MPLTQRRSALAREKSERFARSDTGDAAELRGGIGHRAPCLRQVTRASKRRATRPVRVAWSLLSATSRRYPEANPRTARGNTAPPPPTQVGASRRKHR